MKNKIALTLCATLLTSWGCAGAPGEEVPTEETEEFEVVHARQALAPGASIDDAAVERLRVANTYSAALVYKKMREIEGDKSFVFSPFSLSRAMSNYYTPNYLEEAFEGLFGFTAESTSEDAWLMTSHVAMERDVPADTPADERSRFVTSDIQWVDADSGTVDRNFDLVHALPMADDPERAIEIINAWIEKRSGGILKDFLASDTQLFGEVTTNVLFFTGPWLGGFEKSGDLDFAAPSGEKSLPAFMSGEGTSVGVKMLEGVTVLTMPFADSYSFVVLMPDGDLAAFDATLDQPTIAGLFEAPVDDDVSVVMPTIDLKSTPPLKQGLYELSDENGWGLAEPGSTLSGGHIESIIQKAAIEVDHTGARAAAATVVIPGDNNSGGPSTLIEVNKPFVYVLKDDVSGNILFMGAFTGE